MSPLNTTRNFGNLALGINLNYEVDAYPAYISNYQQHLDIYTATFTPAIPIAQLGVSAGLTAQVTFARLMPDKASAIFTAPYWLDRFPLTAKRLLSNLNPGDLARLDLTLGVSAGVGVVDIPNIHYTGIVSANLTRGSELIVDVYRMRDSLAHVRILALRHQFEAAVGLSADLLNLIDHGIGIWNRLVGRFFTIHLIGAVDTFTPTRSLPLETYMVDYIFDFSKPDAVAAYDQMMDALHSWTLFKTLNFQMNSDNVATRLLGLIQKTEEIAIRDHNKPTADRAVNRLFKGDTDTAYNTFSLTSKIRLLLTLWDREIDTNSSNLSVRGYDSSDADTDLIYMSSTHNDMFNAFQEIWQTLETTTSEALFFAKRISNTGSIVLTPLAPAEIQIIRNLSDKTLKPDQLARAKAFVDLTLPAGAAQQINWGPMVDGQPKFDAYANLKLVIHGSAFQLMRPISEGDLDQLIRDLIEKDPYSNYIATMNRQARSYPKEETPDPLLLMEDDVQALKQRIRVMIDPAQPPEVKLMAFDQARNQSLFNEIGFAVLIALLPPEQLEDQVYVALHAGGMNLVVPDSHFGSHDVSQSYSSFQFMISMINNRSFDMRVQLDSEGNFEHIDPAAANQVCTTCDTLRSKTELSPPQAGTSGTPVPPTVP